MSHELHDQATDQNNTDVGGSDGDKDVNKDTNRDVDKTSDADKKSIAGGDDLPADADKEVEGDKDTDPDKKDGDDKDKIADGAPEAYEQFKLPEGMKMDEAVLGSFSDLAKTDNLTQEQAQKYIDLVSEMPDKIMAEQQKVWSDQREKWVDELKSDSDLGGKNFVETAERARRALRTFGNPELINFMNVTGFGDNADLVRMFVKIDKATGEGKSVDGDPKNVSEVPLANRLYPDNK